MRGNKAEVRELGKEFSSKAKLAKLAYKVEEKHKVGNAKDAWRGLNTMMGSKINQQTVKTDDPCDFANELNRYYARFDVSDFSSEHDNVCRSLVPSLVCVEEGDVISCFPGLNPSKAPGPDGLKGRVLKVCAQQLGPVFDRLFQLFQDSMSVPRAWKSSIIVPLPKKPNVKQMKNFRPVALTSILVKCL